MKRNEFIDFTKGILILLVTTGHALQFGVHRNQGFLDDPLFQLIYLFHMPLFMAISGFLAWPAIESRPPGTNILDRLRSYILPIFVWAVLYRIFVVARVAPATASHLPAAIFHEAIYSLWFLWSLFSATVLTVVIKAIAPKQYFSGAYLASLLAVLFLPESGWLYLFKYIYPFFQLGYVVAGQAQRRLPPARGGVLFWSAAAIGAICLELSSPVTSVYVSGMRLIGSNVGPILLRWLGGVSGSVSALYILFWIFRAIPAGIRQVLQRLGADSLFVYIMQGYFFIWVSYWVTRTYYPTFPLTTGWAAGLIVGLFVAALCWGAGWLLTRSSILGFLLFGKQRRRRHSLPSG